LGVNRFWVQIGVKISYVSNECKNYLGVKQE